MHCPSRGNKRDTQRPWQPRQLQMVPAPSDTVQNRSRCRGAGRGQRLINHKSSEIATLTRMHVVIGK
jgi:hypothetical protein